MHRSPEVPPQHFNEVESEIWLGHCNSYVFQSFCYRFAGEFGIVVLLHHYFGQVQLDWHVAYTLVHWGVHVWLSDWKVLRSRGCKTSPNHHSSENCDWKFARVVSANLSRAAMFREKRLSPGNPSKQAILAVLQWTWKFDMPTEACRVWDGALGFSAASLTLGLTLGSFAGTSTPAKSAAMY